MHYLHYSRERRYGSGDHELHSTYKLNNFSYRWRESGKLWWGHIKLNIYFRVGECKTLENGDEESMLGMTKTIHCIFLREKAPFFKAKWRTSTANCHCITVLSPLYATICKRQPTFSFIFLSFFSLPEIFISYPSLVFSHLLLLPWRTIFSVKVPSLISLLLD